MKKLTIILCSVLAIASVFAFKNYQKAQAATQSATLSATVQEYLGFTITGEAVAFGSLYPGIPVSVPTTGTITGVTTNSANGYTIALNDGVTGSGSVLLHSDGTTRIADFSGTIDTPTVWTDGISKGLGITLYSAESAKESKWGNGTTFDDSANYYSGIPENASVAHTVTGAITGEDTADWAFKLDVPSSQKTGSYSGVVTFTATGVLN